MEEGEKTLCVTCVIKSVCVGTEVLWGEFMCPCLEGRRVCT